MHWVAFRFQLWRAASLRRYEFQSHVGEVQLDFHIFQILPSATAAQNIWLGFYYLYFRLQCVRLPCTLKNVAKECGTITMC